MKSLSEIETIVKRATKASGYSWGVAEETAKCVRLLESFGLPGIKHINKYFSQRKENSFQNFIFSRNHLNNRSFKYYNNDENNPEGKIQDYISQEIENKFRFENTYRKNG